MGNAYSVIRNAYSVLRDACCVVGAWLAPALLMVTPVRWQTPFAWQDADYWQPAPDHRRSID